MPRFLGWPCVKRYALPTAWAVAQLAVVAPLVVRLLQWTSNHVCGLLPPEGLNRGPSAVSCGWCALHGWAVIFGVTAIAVVVVRFVGKVRAIAEEEACIRWRLLTRWPGKRWVSRREDLP